MNDIQLNSSSFQQILEHEMIIDGSFRTGCSISTTKGQHKIYPRGPMVLVDVAVFRRDNQMQPIADYG